MGWESHQKLIRSRFPHLPWPIITKNLRQLLLKLFQRNLTLPDHHHPTICYVQPPCSLRADQDDRTTILLQHSPCMLPPVVPSSISDSRSCSVQDCTYKAYLRLQANANEMTRLFTVVAGQMPIFRIYLHQINRMIKHGLFTFVLFPLPLTLLILASPLILLLLILKPVLSLLVLMRLTWHWWPWWPLRSEPRTL
jgi:hypothetical protein